MAARTPEFYIAMVLVILFFVILVLLIYLLLNPTHNVFDRIGKFFTRKSEKIQKRGDNKEPVKHEPKMVGEEPKKKHWFSRKKQ